MNISRQFSCKLKKINEKPPEMVITDEYKTFIKNLYLIKSYWRQRLKTKFRGRFYVGAAPKDAYVLKRSA